jgi:hypothetical protein
MLARKWIWIVIVLLLALVACNNGNVTDDAATPTAVVEAPQPAATEEPAPAPTAPPPPHGRARSGYRKCRDRGRAGNPPHRLARKT